MDDRFGLEPLIAPLNDGAGNDPRGGGGGAHAAAFLSLKDARGEARLAERDALASGDPDVDPLTAGLRHWQAVSAGARALLSEAAKDVQVAAWLCEAWTRTDGFAGLAAGIALLADLVEIYWDEGLHPQEDDDGVETRVAPLFGLFGNADAGTLLQPIKLLSLSDVAEPRVALWTVESVRAQTVRHDDPEIAEELAARRQKRLDEIEGAIGRASPAFVAETTRGIADSLAAIDRLMTAIDARTPLGRFGTQVSRPLEDAAALLRVHATPTEVADETPDMPQAILQEDGGARPAPGGPQPVADGGLTRERALATLLDVAAFFDRNEPQSLIGQSLRDVVRRANLPLGELLAELLPDGEQRALFMLRAGITAGHTATDDGY